ncbi:MAG: sulfatase-like hydrolase/transferase [Chloroflexota bacterium]
MTKPNILWIYCDELRTDALGCYGNPYVDVQTPHIDSIAETGIRFDNCFCNSPVCVASRASILTGLYPEATGIYHNEAVWENYRFEQQPLTLPGVLAEHGYATANFGKVHVPKALQPWHHSQVEGSGMPELYAGVDMADLQPIRTPGMPTVIGGRYPDDRPYPSDKVTDNALKWLSQNDGPYLARLSYLQPHTPVFPPPPFDTMYADGNFPQTIVESGTTSRFEQAFANVTRGRDMPSEDIVRAKVSYYGLCSWIDSQVGRILDFLRERDELEQTIIIFEADHGASHGEEGRYQKQTFAPESHRVPRLISWAGTIPSRQVRTDISESLDLGRTLFALTDIDAPDQFQGRDLLAEDAPEAVYGTIGYGFASSRAFPNLAVGQYDEEHGWPRRSCVRTAQYRLDKNIRLDGNPVSVEQEDIFLADVVADPQENTNIAHLPEMHDIVKALSTFIDQHTAQAVEVPEVYTERGEAQLKRIASNRKKFDLG